MSVVKGNLCPQSQKVNNGVNMLASEKHPSLLLKIVNSGQESFVKDKTRLSNLC